MDLPARTIVRAGILSGGPRKARGGGPAQAMGRVSLVGAGPGAARHLTRAAIKRLRQADVVLHDALLPPAILAMVPPRARLVPVGKRDGRPGPGQEEINRMLVAEASAGRRVVRLKGGDPLIFGRAGEEIDALERAGIRWEIIPGITAALGAAAAFGLPLTRRDGADCVLLTTATHCGPGRTARLPEHPAETLVYYMAGRRLETLARALLEAGLPPKTPVAVIERATWDDEECHPMFLGDLEGFRRAHRVRAPAMLMVGPSAAPRSWRRRSGGGRHGEGFDCAPPPRPERAVAIGERPFIALGGVLQDLPRLARKLRRSGWGVHEVALLRVAPSPTPHLLPARLRHLGSYAQIHFADRHTVAPFLAELLRLGMDLRDLHGLTLVAGDSATARALAARGLRAGRPVRSGSTLWLCGPGTPGASGDRALDRVEVYAHERLSIDLETLMDELRAEPPRHWLATGPESARELESIRAALAGLEKTPRPDGRAAPRPASETADHPAKERGDETITPQRKASS